MAESSFLQSIEAIRKRAREHVKQGAVVENYLADRETVIRLLNEALATEIVCALRYKRHYFTAQGIHALPVAEEFREHAAEEQEHADRIAERISQLGGEPDYNPEGIVQRSHSEYVEGSSLLDMVREDLVAERIAVESYTEMVRYFGDRDPTSRRLMEEILAKEEEHADDLAGILSGLDEAAGAAELQQDHLQPKDVGYGPSHGYNASHGGPTGPGDAPAAEPRR